MSTRLKETHDYIVAVGTLSNRIAELEAALAAERARREAAEGLLGVADIAVKHLAETTPIDPGAEVLHGNIRAHFAAHGENARD